ncbi:hypothetical protein L208DRAFT_1476566 [Tricholoma matsutake]|nr:hypothetical protein L208DRAFT_1476566 [Tricholoma matsutake 945]
MLFKEHGWALGLTLLTLFPPSETCSNLDCMRHGSILKKEEQCAVVVYTTGHGVLSAWSIHLSCSACHTNYHNDYSVCNGIHMYCPKKPTYIQVREHQFVEEKVVALWTGQMLLGWFSASNAAKLYDMAMARDYLKGSEWPFGTKLTTNHVWDGFILAALLADHQWQGTCLQVPHTGEQKDRFKAAMESQNEHIVLYGQPGAVHHVCHKCMCVYEMDGEYHIVGKCQVIVGDGINMGHPCCGIFRCVLPLDNNRHHFCLMHFSHHDICAIKGCDLPVVKDKKTCSLAAHQKMEEINTAHGKAAFMLKQRLQHAKVSNPTHAIVTSYEMEAEADDVEEHNEWFKIAGEDVHMFNAPNPPSIGVVDNAMDIEVPCPSKKLDTGNTKVKAQFGRRRMHNEQTLVHPCSIIFAWATMYGAEAVSNFLVMVKNAFSVPGAQKPEHLIYDSNCDAKQQVMASQDPYFQDMGMCVDVWHFLNKHKVTHHFCQENCNPAMYPELQDGEKGAWFFNTSVMEQTNAWLGGYHSMCREMLPAKFNFFLMR